VINGRPELIDNFASQNGNVERRLNQEINCFFSVRIRDDFVRTCGGSNIDNNAIDFVQMLCCADDFETGGIETINHTGRPFLFARRASFRGGATCSVPFAPSNIFPKSFAASLSAPSER
jgi:hypothetical protein